VEGIGAMTTNPMFSAIPSESASAPGTTYADLGTHQAYGERPVGGGDTQYATIEPEPDTPSGGQSQSAATPYAVPGADATMCGGVGGVPQYEQPDSAYALVDYSQVVGGNATYAGAARPPSSTAICSYRSARDGMVCRNGALSGGEHCKAHTCERHGCANIKSSQVSLCDAHAGGRDDNVYDEAVEMRFNGANQEGNHQHSAKVNIDGTDGRHPALDGISSA